MGYGRRMVRPWLERRRSGHWAWHPAGHRHVLTALVCALLCLALVGCPKKPRRTLVPAVPTDGDPTARARFVEARDRYLRDGGGQAELVAIARDYPDDPVTPFALLYAGMAAVAAGDDAAAIDALLGIATLPDVPPGLAARAELFLGIAHARAGDPERALPYLVRSEPAVETADERALWLGATAAASAASSTPLDALPWMDRFWEVATEPERGWVLARLDEVVAAAAPDALRAAWDGLIQAGATSGPAAAVAGARLAAILETEGDADAAREVRGAIRGARERLGLRADGDGGGAVAVAAGPPHLGAVLPLDGKQSRVAEAAARGAAIAAGAHGGDTAATVDVEGAAGAKPSAAAVAALADRGVLAILGPIDGDSVDAAAARAADLGVPLVSLNPRADERPASGRWVFHVMHSAEQRARILARRAVAAGVKKLAILAPDSGYGRAVAGAFADAARDAGGEVVVRVDYPADEKSFAKLVKKLDGGWQGVFVPEQADRLELIAPALSAAGLVPRAAGAKLPKTVKGRAIVLLSTAEGMDAEYVRDAGRHSIGALLAPGFYPDRSDARIAAFVDRHAAAHDRPPTAVDAYAFDAIVALGAAAGGAQDRAAVAAALGKLQLEGVTGTVRFGADHRRDDDGVVFTIEDDGATVRTLR